MMNFREANFSKETIFKSCKKFHFLWIFQELAFQMKNPTIFLKIVFDDENCISFVEQFTREKFHGFFGKSFSTMKISWAFQKVVFKRNIPCVFKNHFQKDESIGFLKRYFSLGNSICFWRSIFLGTENPKSFRKFFILKIMGFIDFL